MIRVAGGAANKEVVSLIVLEQAQFPKLRKLTVKLATSPAASALHVDTNLASHAGFLTDTFGEGKLGEIIHDFYTALAAYHAENWTEVHGELIGTPNPLPAPELLLVFAFVHTTLILPSQLGVLLHHAAEEHGFEVEQDEDRGILNKRGFVAYRIARRRINPYLHALNPTTSDQFAVLSYWEMRAVDRAALAAKTNVPDKSDIRPAGLTDEVQLEYIDDILHGISAATFHRLNSGFMAAARFRIPGENVE